jgi:hypothetical protein
VQAKKAVGQDSTVQVGAELSLYEVRDRVVAVPSACEKGFEVFAYRLIQQCLFRATP